MTKNAANYSIYQDTQQVRSALKGFASSLGIPLRAYIKQAIDGFVQEPRFDRAEFDRLNCGQMHRVANAPKRVWIATPCGESDEVEEFKELAHSFGVLPCELMRYAVATQVVGFPRPIPIEADSPHSFRLMVGVETAHALKLQAEKLDMPVKTLIVEIVNDGLKRNVPVANGGTPSGEKKVVVTTIDGKRFAYAQLLFQAAQEKIRPSKLVQHYIESALGNATFLESLHTRYKGAL
ncbi:hypothetical protein [Stenotrophomonas sp. SG1]|uniref:hypothetical protein n=1 Tax=Stenotrophomonas sp. SG1 TaxID=2944932 RepID=UPI00224308EA|nr:hypothetical protein [Stenotrophomonas sp. SG1]MCW8340552.1 hypothetical protein [Stenotrophomonas sp. SG1]